METLTSSVDFVAIVTNAEAVECNILVLVSRNRFLLIEVPRNHLPVVSGGYDELSVFRNLHSVWRVCMPVHHRKRRVIVEVPHPHRHVAAARNEIFIMGQRHKSKHKVLVT